MTLEGRRRGRWGKVVAAKMYWHVATHPGCSQSGPAAQGGRHAKSLPVERPMDDSRGQAARPVGQGRGG